MSITIDELLRLAALELAEREKEKKALVPGRALRYHGGRSPKSTFLGGKHS